jgi:hypothetical protein
MKNDFHDNVFWGGLGDHLVFGVSNDYFQRHYQWLTLSQGLQFGKYKTNK